MNVFNIDWSWSKIANTAKKEEQMLNESYECELLSWAVESVYHAKKYPNAKHLNVLQMIIIVD